MHNQNDLSNCTHYIIRFDIEKQYFNWAIEIPQTGLADNAKIIADGILYWQLFNLLNCLFIINIIFPFALLVLIKHLRFLASRRSNNRLHGFMYALMKSAG